MNLLRQYNLFITVHRTYYNPLGSRAIETSKHLVSHKKIGKKMGYRQVLAIM